MDKNYLTLIAKDSSKYLNISETFPDFQNNKTLEDWLTNEIAYLLDHDFESLINAMYRIDVDENKVMETLEWRQTDQIPRQLAHLVIKRVFEKIKTRERFGSS